MQWKLLLKLFLNTTTLVAFNFPAGHIENNNTIILGQTAKLEMTNNNSIDFLGRYRKIFYASYMPYPSLAIANPLISVKISIKMYTVPPRWCCTFF